MSIIYFCHSEGQEGNRKKAGEEFENKELHAVELARLKYLLKLVIDSMDSITKDPNVSIADRINSRGSGSRFD